MAGPDLAMCKGVDGATNTFEIESYPIVNRLDVEATRLRNPGTLYGLRLPVSGGMGIFWTRPKTTARSQCVTGSVGVVLKSPDNR